MLHAQSHTAQPSAALALYSRALPSAAPALDRLSSGSSERSSESEAAQAELLSCPAQHGSAPEADELADVNAFLQSATSSGTWSDISGVQPLAEASTRVLASWQAGPSALATLPARTDVLPGGKRRETLDEPLTTNDEEASERSSKHSSEERSASSASQADSRQESSSGASAAGKSAARGLSPRQRAMLCALAAQRAASGASGGTPEPSASQALATLKVGVPARAAAALTALPAVRDGDLAARLSDMLSQTSAGLLATLAAERSAAAARAVRAHSELLPAPHLATASPGDAEASGRDSPLDSLARLAECAASLDGAAEQTVVSVDPSIQQATPPEVVAHDAAAAADCVSESWRTLERPHVAARDFIGKPAPSPARLAGEGEPRLSATALLQPLRGASLTAATPRPPSAAAIAAVARPPVYDTPPADSSDKAALEQAVGILADHVPWLVDDVTQRTLEQRSIAAFPLAPPSTGGPPGSPARQYFSARYGLDGTAAERAPAPRSTAATSGPVRYPPASAGLLAMLRA